MRVLVLAALWGGLALSAAHAANLTVDADGAKKTYTLKSVSVDASGNVAVIAASSGTTPSDPAPDDPPVGPVTPVDPPVGPVTPPDPSAPGAACVPSATLTCVNTPLPQKVQSRLSYRPVPTMVYAFKVTTPATGSYFNRVIATGMSGATSSKMLVVSKTPGDVSTAGKDLGCYRLSAESTSVQLAVNLPNANKYLNCKLEPNTVYYINAVSKDFQGRTTCTTASSCGFYFEGT